jgi:hypothetical protein
MGLCGLSALSVLGKVDMALIHGGVCLQVQQDRLKIRILLCMESAPLAFSNQVMAGARVVT